MKTIRKGLGRGMGTGYKNLIPVDSHVHSLSAKGIKSTTSVPIPKGYYPVSFEIDYDDPDAEYTYEYRSKKIFNNLAKIGAIRVSSSSPNGLLHKFGYLVPVKNLSEYSKLKL